MSGVSLDPGIGSLDPASLCYSLYRQLYQRFFNAQERKSAENPFGVEEGDATSLRLHNAAYGFAEAIASGVAGEGSGGTGILAGYLPKSGGDMSGPLTAEYGFVAGLDNRRLVETFRTAGTGGYDYGVRISGALHLGAGGLCLGGGQVLGYDPTAEALCLYGKRVVFPDASLRLGGELLIGADRTAGLCLSATEALFHGRELYHGGNANLPTVDWAMRDAAVAGRLDVAGCTSLCGVLRALQGAELGAGGEALLTASEGGLAAFCDVSFAAGCGVCLGGVTVLRSSGAQDVRLEGAGGELLLGGDHTQQVRLQSGLTDIDGEHVLLSAYGAGYFPAGLRVRHDYGGEVLSSYHRDENGENGILLHERLRFGNADTGPVLQDYGGYMAFVGNLAYMWEGAMQQEEHIALFGFDTSPSVHAPQGSRSCSMLFGTTADLLTLYNPLEVADYIGIGGSFTRLTQQGLFFSDGIYLQQTADGLYHSGRASFGEGVGSRLFTSGMAGSGWAILPGGATGSAAATFDELTVRKRMRAYELEVQRATATNGSLWVTDACPGDHVEKL